VTERLQLLDILDRVWSAEYRHRWPDHRCEARWNDDDAEVIADVAVGGCLTGVSDVAECDQIPFEHKASLSSE
jgi:hypothetical protein